MSCATIPIPQIVTIGMLSDLKLPSNGLLGKWFRLTTMLQLPGLVKLIADRLPNEALLKMSHEEAAKSYLPYSFLHRNLVAQINRFTSSHPVLARSIFKRWVEEMTLHAERIGDIAEALAWSADETLKNRLLDAVQKVEQRQLQLSQ